MLKEAGLFIISAGFLVYFISPSEEEPKPKPVIAETAKNANADQTQKSDYWDEDDDEEDNFVFGQPVEYSEESTSETDDEAEQETSVAPVVSPQPVRSAKRSAYKKPPVFKKSPAPGELGSRENPIVMSPAYSRR